jgi:GntR family transcriptional regulator/MocR family aminotransferase
MSDAIIYIDPDQPMNLQNQIRQKLVEGILNGSFPPGMKLSSSRKLAHQLNVARNTVVLAYQQLVAEGDLVSRQRSGIFVKKEILESRAGYGGETRTASDASAQSWRKRTKGAEIRRPIMAGDLPNW